MSRVGAQGPRVRAGAGAIRGGVTPRGTELVPKNFLLQPFLSRFIFKMVPKPDDEYVQLKWYSAMRAWSEFVGVNDAKAILVRPRIDRVRPISPQNRVDLHVFPGGFFRGIFRTRACTRTSQAARASDAP